jgi:thiol-disulfide isomerase/thioredoxin
MKELLFVMGKSCNASEEMVEKVDLFKAQNPEVLVTTLVAGKDEKIFIEKTDGHRFSSTPAFVAIENNEVLDRHEGKLCEVRLATMFYPNLNKSPNNNNLQLNETKSVGKRIIFFSGSWCEFCKESDQILKVVSEKDPSIEIFKIDVEESPELVKEHCYNQIIDGVPNFIFTVDGNMINKKAGMLSVNEFLDNFSANK